MKLEQAKTQWASACVGHNAWFRKTYDPKNSKLTVPRDIAESARMQDREYYCCASPEDEKTLDAIITLMKYYFHKGAPVIVYLWSGKEEGKE